jgi:uncharacterized protein (TIGR03083 family)
MDEVATQDGLTARYIAAEQAEFATMLRSLPRDAWRAPSICAGWSIRSVVVHAAAHIHDQQQDKTAVGHYSRCPEEELISWLESPPNEVDSPSAIIRRRSAEIQRGELMIHQQDVRRSLGVRRSIPLDRVGRVLSFGLQPIGSLGLAFARERAVGLRLVSIEDDWTWGRGKETRGTLEAILMATAGRTQALEELDGPGAGILADRIRNPSKVLQDLNDYAATVNPVD